MFWPDRDSCKVGTVLLCCLVAPLFGRAFIFPQKHLTPNQYHPKVTPIFPQHCVLLLGGRDRRREGEKQGSTGVSKVYETGSVRMGSESQAD